MRLYSFNMGGNLHSLAHVVQKWDDGYRASLGYESETQMEAYGTRTFAEALVTGEFTGGNTVSVFALNANQAAYLREKGWLQ